MQGLSKIEGDERTQMQGALGSQQLEEVIGCVWQRARGSQPTQGQQAKEVALQQGLIPTTIGYGMTNEVHAAGSPREEDTTLVR